MKKSKKRIILISIALLLITAAAAFFIVQKNIIGRKSEVKGEKEERIYPVRIEKSRLGTISDFIRINGSVVAERSVDVNPDTGGKIKLIYPEIGDYVEKGEIIAEVDPSKPGLSYTSSPVRAPIAGTVTFLPVETGSNVTVSSVIATIGDLSMLRVETEIPEPEIAKIKMGSESLLSFVSYPGKNYPSKVVEISPVVNPLTRTMKIKLAFTAENDEIRAGMFCSVKLFTETKSDAVIIPSSSVVVRDGADTVFILEDNDIVRKVRVETGIIAEGNTEIENGLSQGDIVVTAGQNLLEDGVRVKILAGSGDSEKIGDES